MVAQLGRVIFLMAYHLASVKLVAQDNLLFRALGQITITHANDRFEGCFLNRTYSIILLYISSIGFEPDLVLLIGVV